MQHLKWILFPCYGFIEKLATSHSVQHHMFLFLWEENVENRCVCVGKAPSGNTCARDKRKLRPVLLHLNSHSTLTGLQRRVQRLDHEAKAD